MEITNFLLIYLLFSAGATVCALFYWMAVENVQPSNSKQAEHKKLILIFIISVLTTPVGAYIYSLFFKLRKAAPLLKNS
jgi:hypothetical protein